MRCGRTPPSSRATSAGSVALPQSRRWLPSSQRSPGCVTGTAGGSGVSSSRGSACAEREQRVDLRSLEAEGGEVDAEFAEVRHLEREQLLVPAGLLGEAVVGEDVGALLRFAEVGELDHRHRGEAELARREHPSVAGDDAVVAVDQHRVA